MAEMAEKRSIAEVICEAETPTGEMFKLSNKAADLLSAIRVAVKWIDASMSEGPRGEMWERAEKIHDELEEELSRVAWEIEIVRESRREEVFNEERPEERKVENPEAVSRAAYLSESLMEAYTILAGIPQEHLGLCGDEAAPRTRYRLMGALLEAKDSADAEMARLDPRAQA